MSKTKEQPYFCFSSSKILIHPDGDIEDSVLEDLLYKLSTENIPRSRRVQISIHQRVKGFNPEEPAWETVQSTRTASYLFRLYRDIHGDDYVAPSREVHARMEKHRYNIARR